MRRALLFALLLRAAVALGASPASPAPSTEPGTTLVGERDAAVGLYLLPWKEEAPSDIDRAPRRYAPATGPVDTGDFAARTAADEAEAAYRRVRLEPK